MKRCIAAGCIVMFFASCLKQTIPDAMLAKAAGKTTASLTYNINGNPVNIVMKNADKQNPTNLTLGVSRSGMNYTLVGIGISGQTYIPLFTNTLAVGNYKYRGEYVDLLVIDYNNQNEYAYAPSDSVNVNIVSNENGRISGNFSGQLTPLKNNGNPYNVYGDFSSIKVTNGSFQNVPVF